MTSTPAPIAHYENFPVASWLCPRHLRAPIAAIYHFARTADDLADEGEAPPEQRLADLAAYRDELAAAAAGAAVSRRWAAVFEPLAEQMQRFQLPQQPFQDLLSAFVQDVRQSAARATYADLQALLDYCRRSANPIGRLLLHLYGIDDDAARAQSDQVCSALQLINFWQDLSVDLPRGRCYLPLAECASLGLPLADLPHALVELPRHPRAGPLVIALVRHARALMLEGAPLVHRVPGRAGWELRAVVQGGLRVLEQIEALGPRVLRQRPLLTRADAPRLLWRMLRM
mgnify:CR=1 FL=1